jgi:hypothetical protein
MFPTVDEARERLSAMQEGLLERAESVPATRASLDPERFLRMIDRMVEAPR